MASYTFQPSSQDEYYNITQCTCCRFANGVVLPLPNRDIDFDTILHKAQKFSASILADFTAIEAIAERFEEVMQKRWSKKNEKQRRALLLKACPNINNFHRPNFDVLGTQAKAGTLNQTKREYAFLWPYLNLQDLVQGPVLCTLIKARARNDPSIFATADLEEAYRSHFWPDEFDLDCDGPLVEIGGKAPEDYLKRSAHRKIDQYPPILYHPIVGLFILEIQVGVYSFVRKTCDAILHDMSTSQILKAPILPEPFPNYKSAWYSSTLMPLGGRYRAPHEFDLELMKTLAMTHLYEAEDHIWSLREDPSYFLHSIRNAKEHGPDAESKDQEAGWKNAAGATLVEAFCSFMLWHELNSVLSTMRTLETQLQFANPCTGRLSAPDEIKWAAVDELLVILMALPANTLPRASVYAPRLRQSFSKVLSAHADSLWLQDGELRIHRLFSDLIEGEKASKHGMQLVLDDARFMINTDKAVAQYFDSCILEVLEDYAIACDLKHCVDSFLPWVRGWRAAGLAKKPPVQDVIEDVMCRDVSILEAINSKSHELFKSIGIATDGRFAYPADKKRSEVTVKQMRSAEQKLNQFWSEVRECFSSTMGIDILEEFESRTSQTDRGIQVTPEWVNQGQTVQQPRPVVDIVDHNAWQHQQSPVSENRKTEIESSTGKEKTKTRGPVPQFEAGQAAGQAQQGDGAAAEPRDEPEEPAKIRVTRRVFGVLTNLLGHSDIRNRPNEVAWDDLLYAFNAIGLTPEKLYGSVWIFRPGQAVEGNDGCDKVQVTRSIQFHEPKDVRKGSKIPPFMARRFGRRLKRAYGWNGDMFELI